jgi:WD40 repeat protein
MKLYEWQCFYALLVAISILLSCQSQSEQERILYSDFSKIRIENFDGTSVVDIEMGGIVRIAEWSPSGTQISMVVEEEGRGSIWITKADGSEPYQVNNEFDFTWVTWLSDNLLLATAFTKGESVEQDVYTNYILNLQDGSIEMYSERLEPVIPLSSGDRWLGWGFYSHQVHLYNLNGEAKPLFTEFSLTEYNHIDISPSTQEFVFCNQDHYSEKPVRPNGLYKASLDLNIVPEPEFVYQSDGCLSVKWSPNGQYIALLDRQNVIHILDGKKFSLVKKVKVEGLLESDFIWSPDSKFIAVNKHYDDPDVIWGNLAKVDIETGEFIRLTEGSKRQRILDWRILALQ